MPWRATSPMEERIQFVKDESETVKWPNRSDVLESPTANPHHQKPSGERFARASRSR